MNNYGLNDEQYDAVVTDQSPVSFINASAGAGKTRCLIARIQHILEGEKADPSSILALTFTNRAANEVKERLKKHGDISKMQVSTFHSACVRIIRKFIYHTYLKYPFTIYDESDQMSVVKSIVKAGSFSGDPYEYLKTISNLKSECILPGNLTELPVNDFGQEIVGFERVYKQYQGILKQNNACDFDDLLILAYGCLQHEDCKKYFTNMWKYILIDEFQDSSAIQLSIVKSLYDASITKSMTCVGDFSQSIYSFRGAKPSNIDDFIKTYNATVKYLSYNYRSSSDVINIANKFQQFGKPMVPKLAIPGKVSVTEFQSLEDEAEKIALALLKMGNFNSTAVIYRMNSRSLYFEQTFSKYHIPYKVVNSLPFYQRKVCKDLLAALAAANNPEDRSSLARVINTPKRGFGDAKKVRLMEQGREYLTENIHDMPLVKPFLNLLDDIKGMPPSLALTEYLNRSGYWGTIDKDSDRYMIQSLQNAVTGFKTVEELVLASSFLEKDSGEGVSLITAHGSKGLEFDRVFVVGVEEGTWPHKNAKDLAEEKRLYYVAISRARNYLNLSYSKAKTYKGVQLNNEPSPLFMEAYEHLHGKALT